MRTVGWFFLLCVIGIVVVTTVLFGETAIFNLLPSAPVTRGINAILTIFLEAMDVSFIAGAIASIFMWVRPSSEGSDC